MGNSSVPVTTPTEDEPSDELNNAFIDPVTDPSRDSSRLSSDPSRSDNSSGRSRGEWRAVPGPDAEPVEVAEAQPVVEVGGHPGGSPPDSGSSGSSSSSRDTDESNGSGRTRRWVTISSDTGSYFYCPNRELGPDDELVRFTTLHDDGAKLLRLRGPMFVGKTFDPLFRNQAFRLQNPTLKWSWADECFQFRYGHLHYLHSCQFL